MKHNWLVTVLTEKNVEQTLRVRAGNDEGAQRKVCNEHPDVKIVRVRSDGA
ncbi:MAG TPA: hypothetical protein VGM51_13445 [Armatimonadota bacterium]|jgi:hypothetical protein